MLPMMRPADLTELSRVISEARATNTPIEVMGAGSKQAIGHPMQTLVNLSTRALRGVTLYEPGEMVMAARAGTPIAHIESQLAAHGQMLGFEPVDMGPMLGGEAGQTTIGGALASNLSGARRVIAGAARDHALGLSGVTGSGEIFRSGGRVLKNTAGYNLTQALAGSWGTLAVFAEVAFKVVPSPEETITLLFLGLPDEIAVEVMCAALATPYEVSGTVHLQTAMVERLWHEGIKAERQAVTALRLENFSRLVGYRKARLLDDLGAFGDMHELDHENSLAFWSELQQMSVMCGSNAPLWRISTSPRSGAKIVSALSGDMDCNAYYDWSGGLIWLEVLSTSDASSADIRRAVASNGGHATLIRAASEIRAAVEVFQPLEAGIERLTRGIKQSFDPDGILNPGRMYMGM